MLSTNPEKTTPQASPSPTYGYILSRKSTRQVVVGCPFRKPDCCLFKRLHLVRYSYNSLCIQCSISLLTQDNTEIGRKLSAMGLSPPLCKGVMMVSFHNSGTVLKVMLILNKQYNTGRSFVFAASIINDVSHDLLRGTSLID